MSRLNAFFLLSPEYLTNNNAKNHHIFIGYHETHSNNWKIGKKESVCGQVECKTSFTSTHKGTDAAAFFHRLIDLHVEGKNVCGQCMARFFADGENL